MNQTNVKSRLLSKISEIEDENILNEIEEIVSNLKDENLEIFLLDNEIKDSIANSELDIKNDKLISNDVAMKQMKEWLKNK